MTNAIEQTRREMYSALSTLKGRIEINYSIKDMQRGADEFEHSLEAHLGELNKDRKFCEDIVALSEAKAAKAKEECDTLRNRIQAFEMASQTSAEIIKGLRAELQNANRSFNCTINPSEEARKNANMQDLMRACTSAQDSKENAASAKTDPYTLGYSSVGKCSNPFPINTVERLHWENGHVDRMKSMTVAVYNGDMPWMVRS